MSTSVRRASGSLTTVRRSSFCTGSVVSSGGAAGPDGMPSKYFRTFSTATFASTSPAMASTALFGRVVGLEEIREVFERRGVEVGHRSDNRVLVREVLEQQLADHFRRLAVRLVVHAQAAFFLDRLALVVDVLLRDGRRPHAIGLEEEHHVELVGRHLLEVEGVVLVGLPVVAAAVVLDEPGQLAIGDILRALEHQVLEQVREAGAPFPLVPRSDVVGHGHRHDRRRAIGRDDDAQAVLQACVRVGDLRNGDGRGGGCERNGEQHRGEKAIAFHGCALQDVQQFLQVVQLILRGVNNRPPLLHRRRRPVLVVESDASVFVEFDQKRIHRGHEQSHYSISVFSFRFRFQRCTTPSAHRRRR